MDLSINAETSNRYQNATDSLLPFATAILKLAFPSLIILLTRARKRIQQDHFLHLKVSAEFKLLQTSSEL